MLFPRYNRPSSSLFRYTSVCQHCKLLLIAFNIFYVQVVISTFLQERFCDFRGVVALTIKARNKIIESRSTDEHIDKTIVQDLVSDEDAFAAKQNEKAQKKLRKTEQKLRERLKAERRNNANKKNAAADEDDDEVISTFAKGTRGKKGR